jgi:hypothetical protein
MILLMAQNGWIYILHYYFPRPLLESPLPCPPILWPTAAARFIPVRACIEGFKAPIVFVNSPTKLVPSKNINLLVIL